MGEWMQEAIMLLNGFLLQVFNVVFAS